MRTQPPLLVVLDRVSSSSGSCSSDEARPLTAESGGSSTCRSTLNAAAARELLDEISREELNGMPVRSWSLPGLPARVVRRASPMPPSVGVGSMMPSNGARFFLSFKPADLSFSAEALIAATGVRSFVGRLWRSSGAGLLAFSLSRFASAARRLSVNLPTHLHKPYVLPACSRRSVITLWP